MRFGLPVVISLLVMGMMLFSSFGMAVPTADEDQDDGKLESHVRVWYRDDFVKPDGVGNGKPPKPPKDEGGNYELLGRGVKWKSLPVDYVINPVNPEGLSQDSLVSAITASADEWDSHTTADLFGSYDIDTTATYDDVTPDYRNEIMFGDLDTGIIGVTITWGYFGGPPGQRAIIEFDMVLNTDFSWNVDGNSADMDVQNIVTHELGHGVGLADLYDDADNKETMYGYSWEGDIDKRDLYYGDIAGIQELYN